jgi:uncharacterized membrane protein YphA (DoxX/SURF4 family)
VTAATILSVLSSLAFFVYAIQCLTMARMKAEFERYGVPRLRRLTAILQILAAIGLIVGLRWRPAMTISSCGLMLLMFVALSVRIRIKDGIAQSLPAIALMATNGYIFVESLK